MKRYTSIYFEESGRYGIAQYNIAQKAYVQIPKSDTFLTQDDAQAYADELNADMENY